MFRRLHLCRQTPRQVHVIQSRHINSNDFVFPQSSPTPPPRELLQLQLEADWAKPDTHDLRAVDRDILESAIGAPVAHLDRTVIIEKLAKPSGQQGWGNSRDWILKFQTADAWVNPLMGWAATRDPVNNLSLSFPTSNAAIQFAKANGFKYILDEDTHNLAQSKQTYASKFLYHPPAKPLGGAPKDL